jgi:hypothetical protein
MLTNYFWVREMYLSVRNGDWRNLAYISLYLGIIFIILILRWTFYVVRIIFKVQKFQELSLLPSSVDSSRSECFMIAMLVS